MCIRDRETSQKRGMRLAIVDFPDPEGPTRAVTSPCRAIKEISFSASAVSYTHLIALAEHLRKLSLGFLYKNDSGELSSMLITDFAMTEQGMSHHLPQLLGATSLVLS